MFLVHGVLRHPICFLLKIKIGAKANDLDWKVGNNQTGKSDFPNDVLRRIDSTGCKVATDPMAWSNGSAWLWIGLIES